MDEIGEKQLLGVANTFYDAAYGLTSWRAALNELALALDGSRAWLFRTCPTGIDRETSIDDAAFFSPEALQAMMQDPLFHESRRPREGEVTLQTEMHDLTQLRKRALWQDWLRPRDIHFGMQAHLLVRGDEHLFLEVSRDHRRDDFGNRDKALMRALMPHIRRAGEISTLFTGERGTAGLADVDTGAIVVNERLQVMEVNRAAAALLERGTGTLGILRNILHVADSRARRRLGDLVAASFAPAAEPGIMTIDPWTQDVRRLLLCVAPLRRTEMFGFPGHPLAVIHMRPVDVSAEKRMGDAFVSLFRLSPSQTRLALLIAAGKPLKEAASRLGLSYTTVRTYLDEIYRKTDTHQQGELVALLKSVEASMELSRGVVAAGRPGLWAGCLSLRIERDLPDADR